MTYLLYLIHTHLGPGGAGAPPRFEQGPRYLAGRGWRPSTANHTGGLPLAHVSCLMVAPLLALPVTCTRGASPYFRFFQFVPAYFERPPHVGFPAWGARGVLPLFHVSHSSEKGPPGLWGRGSGTGGPPLISAKQFNPGGLPLSHSVAPCIGSAAPRGHGTINGGPPLVSRHFLGSQVPRPQASAITPAQ